MAETHFLFERAAIMKAAKINARYTSNKCINNLQEFGYIKYQPSSNPINGSKVYLNNLKNMEVTF